MLTSSFRIPSSDPTFLEFPARRVWYGSTQNNNYIMTSRRQQNRELWKNVQNFCRYTFAYVAGLVVFACVLQKNGQNNFGGGVAVCSQNSSQTRFLENGGQTPEIK